MNKLLFWTDNDTRLKDKNSTEYNKFKKLEKFFKKINFEIAAVRENFPEGDYPVFDSQNINSYTYDYIVCHPQSIGQLRKFALDNNIEEKKVVILSYDLNQIQCDLGVHCPNTLFYEEISIKDNILLSEVKEIKIVEKHVKDIPPPADEETQERIIQKAVNSYKLAKNAALTVPKEYQTGSNWGNFLKATRKDFYNAVEKTDWQLLKDMFANFYRNCLTTGTLGGKEAFEFFKNSIGYSRWVTHSFKVWKESLGEKILNISQLGLPSTGNPYGINLDGNIINVNSFLFNYRANFCKRLMPQNKKSLILEIGGGFGGLGYYLHKINTNCTYIDLDIPENLVVTEYFLKMTYPDKKIMTFDTDKLASIDLSKTNLLKYDIILLPNFMLPYFKDNTIDLFINTISLGEMGYDTICEYLKQIDRIGSGYFYHENIANIPAYTGYPVSTYPEMKNFKQINTAISRWGSFDSYSKDYIYTENLLVKNN